MKASDSLSGLVFAIAGLLVIFLALRFPSMPGEVGAGFFPIIIGSILMLAGIAIAIGSALKRRTGPAEATIDMPAANPAAQPLGSGWHDRRAIVALASVPLAIVGWAWLAPVAGAAFASMSIVALLAIAWRARFWPAVLTGIASGIVIHLFFGVAMRVPLPAGLIERLLQ